MDYKDALIEGLLNKELVNEYDRLFGTGFAKDEIIKFDAFFYEFVWSRLPDECFV